MNTKGLLEFMEDVQQVKGLREQAEALLKRMELEGMSHGIFCAAMLKLAVDKGYCVSREEVRKLRSQKNGYEFTDEVKAGKGRCWPFDYSYLLEQKRR